MPLGATLKADKYYYITMSNVFSKINVLEQKHRAFITLVIKPLLSLIVFLSVGYYTLWLSANYVRSEKFSQFIERVEKDAQSREESTKNRFEITQSKLEIIINQQTSFNEQLKTFNTVMSNIQKQHDNLEERILYLERNNKNY